MLRLSDSRYPATGTNVVSDKNTYACTNANLYISSDAYPNANMYISSDADGDPYSYSNGDMQPSATYKDSDSYEYPNANPNTGDNGDEHAGYLTNASTVTTVKANRGVYR